MSDWIAPVAGLLGVIIGAGILELRYRRENKEKYHVMVFEKRLDAYQEAFYWCMRLLWVIRPHRLLKDGGVEKAAEELAEANESFNKKALYFDENTRDKMAKFFIFVATNNMKYIDEEKREQIDVKKEVREVGKILGEVLSSIKKGIGVKYLPEIEINIEKLDVNELWKEIEDSTVKLSKKKP